MSQRKGGRRVGQADTQMRSPSCTVLRYCAQEKCPGDTALEEAAQGSIFMDGFYPSAPS